MSRKTYEGRIGYLEEDADALANGSTVTITLPSTCEGRYSALGARLADGTEVVIGTGGFTVAYDNVGVLTFTNDTGAAFTGTVRVLALA